MKIVVDSLVNKCASIPIYEKINEFRPSSKFVWYDYIGDVRKLVAGEGFYTEAVLNSRLQCVSGPTR